MKKKLRSILHHIKQEISKVESSVKRPVSFLLDPNLVKEDHQFTQKIKSNKYREMYI